MSLAGPGSIASLGARQLDSQSDLERAFVKEFEHPCFIPCNVLFPRSA